MHQLTRAIRAHMANADHHIAQTPTWMEPVSELFAQDSEIQTTDLADTIVDRLPPTQRADPLAPRPSIVIFPLVVFTFTLEPLMQTPSNVPA